jgi:hypothetical protein
MAVAIPFVMIAAAGISAYAAVRQGQVAKAAGDYNAKIGEQNAQLSRQEADMQVKQQERENYLRMGAIRAAQGKNGGAAGEGSVLDILADSAAQGELEKQMISYRGELKARGYTNSAALDRFAGDQARQGSYMKAGAELLGGGASAGYAQSRLTRT